MQAVACNIFPLFQPYTQPTLSFYSPVFRCRVSCYAFMAMAEASPIDGSVEKLASRSPRTCSPVTSRVSYARHTTEVIHSRVTHTGNEV